MQYLNLGWVQTLVGSENTWSLACLEDGAGRGHHHHITSTDVLRGQSWAVANADDSRSTRGGQVQAGFSHRKERAR